jgi:hypothetical protein
MKMNKKFRSISTHILAFFVGLLLPPIVGFFIDDFFKRPQIECDINCMNIIDDENDDLILNLYVQFENTGQSNTTISLDNLRLQFKDVNGKPYSFNLSKKIEIEGLSFVSDTLEVILPKQLDSITVLPEIKTLLLNYHELKNKNNTFIEKKSSDVIWGFIQGKHIPVNPDSFSYHSDYIVNYRTPGWDNHCATGIKTVSKWFSSQGFGFDGRFSSLNSDPLKVKPLKDRSHLTTTTTTTSAQRLLEM